jgi:hypothetical protein
VPVAALGVRHGWSTGDIDTTLLDTTLLDHAIVDLDEQAVSLTPSH